MSQANGSQEPSSAPDRYALRVLRVDPGQSFKIRLVSQRYGGLLTHWVKGRSVLCQGDECPLLNHRSGTYWKGYALVEHWNGIKGLWCPTVLEITENLELDFRGRWERGQVWLLQRAPQLGRHKTSVFGVLMFEGHLDGLRVPFDFLPVIRNLYHVSTIAIDKENPMPARIFVEPTPGTMPCKPADTQDRPATAAEWEEFRKRMQGFQFKDPDNVGSGTPPPSAPLDGKRLTSNGKMPGGGVR
jgi:hypothetical protein